MNRAGEKAPFRRRSLGRGLLEHGGLDEFRYDRTPGYDIAPYINGLFGSARTGDGVVNSGTYGCRSNTDANGDHGGEPG